MKQFLPIGDCPIRNALNRIGDKWSMLVLATLYANDVMRFSEIHRSLGDISHRMLSVTLRTLETDGLILRKVYPQVPPKVEYQLSDMGKTLMPHLHGLVDWAMEHMPEILAARAASEK